MHINVLTNVNAVQVGEFGYLLYPDVQSDLLISFGSSNLYLNIARVGMAAVEIL